MQNRYCIISGIYPPETGGPAKFAVTFSQYLLEKGHQVSVISYTDSATHQIIQNNFRLELVSRKIPIWRRYLRMMFAIFKAIRRREKIIANGCFIELALLRIVFPFTYTTKIPGDIVWERARNQGYTSLGLIEFQSQNLGWRYNIFRTLFSLSLRLSKCVIAPSTQLMELVASWGIPEEKISIIYNSIDINKFQPNLNGNKDLDVITVSRLVLWKGLEEVIEICARNNFSLGVVGDGPLRKSLENLAKNLSTQVTFFGDAQENEIIENLRRARVFVLNSSFEATSYAMLEAMSCGLVPVSNDSTGSVEIILDKKNGILCGPSTGINLESALRHLLSHPKELSAISLQARLTVKEIFNCEINFQKIRALTDG